MQALLARLVAVAVPLFAVTSMAALGLGHSPREVLAPLRRPALVARALVANFVVTPLLALALIRAFRLEGPQATGLFLCGAGAGAAFTVKLVRTARANPALAGGLLVLLLPCTIVFMPLVIPRAIPETVVDFVVIARTLALTMLLPLAVGALVRWRRRGWASRLVPLLGEVASISLIVLIAGTVLGHLPNIRALLATPAIPAAALLAAGATAAGWALGTTSRRYRTVLALGTGQRNIAAAMVVASDFAAPEPLVMVVVCSLVFFAVLFPAAWLLRRVDRPTTPHGGRQTRYEHRPISREPQRT